MKRQRGDNSGNIQTKIEIVSGAEELAAFEELGPLTKQALNDAPIKWLAVAIVKQIREAEEKLRARLPPHVRENFSLNLKDPQLDRNIAIGLQQQSFETLLRDRPQEDALLGLKPLRPTRVQRVKPMSAIKYRRAMRW